MPHLVIALFKLKPRLYWWGSSIKITDVLKVIISTLQLAVPSPRYFDRITVPR
jgi:hypothetical protein